MLLHSNICFQYFLAVMLVLIAECAVYVIASAWPHCLGLGLDPEDLVKELQRNYGAAGQEQFTAAVDLAQATVINYSNFIFTKI